MSRMIWNDIARNKAVALMLLLFVSLAAMLLSLAAMLGRICSVPSTG